MNEEITTTYDIRGTDETALSVDYAWNIGKAFADWLPTDGRLIVAMQPAGEQLAHALIEGLRLQGRSVISGGPLSKEQVSERVTTDKLSGGVLVGYDALQQTPTIEVYQHEGRLITSDTGLNDIVNVAQSGNFVPAAVKGELTSLA
jgi:phosphomannomutase